MFSTSEMRRTDGPKFFGLGEHPAIEFANTVSTPDGQLEDLLCSWPDFLANANLNYLHRCANTKTCTLYFYDTTKNHRRRWCSVAACGNRHKVAAFRSRQKKSSRKEENLIPASPIAQLIDKYCTC